MALAGAALRQNVSHGIVRPCRTPGYAGIAFRLKTYKVTQRLRARSETSLLLPAHRSGFAGMVSVEALQRSGLK